jgi:HK97 family phage portal protein
MLEKLLALFRASLGRPVAEQAKANPVGSLVVGYSGPQEVFPPQFYTTLSKEGYTNSVTVRAVVGRVARVTAELPIKLQRRTRAGAWEDLGANEDDEHPLMALLRKPNPEQTKVDFFEALFASRKIAGESPIAPVGPADSMPPTELWWLRPDKLTCVPGTDGTVSAWKYKTGAGEVTFDMRRRGSTPPLIMWKTWDPLDPWRGLSELKSAAIQVSQLNEGAAWNARTLKNSMRPPGAFVYSPTNETMSPNLTQPQREQLADDIKTNLTGAQNASRPLILDGGLDWKEMSIAPKDLEWLEGMRDAARQVCFLLGYPPIMLGIPGDATYKNYAEARTSFYQDTAIPLMTSLLDVFNETLVPAFGDNLRLVVDVDKIDALADLRATTWDRVNTATFLTPNEKRELVGKPRIDSDLADQLWVPTSMVPLDDIAGTNENDPATDPATDPASAEDQTGAKPPGKRPPSATAFDDNLDAVEKAAGKMIRILTKGAQ